MAHASVDPFADSFPTEDSDATQPSPQTTPQLTPQQPPNSSPNSSTSQATSQPAAAAQARTSAGESSSVETRPEAESEPAPERDRVREHFLNWQVMETSERDALRTGSDRSVRAADVEQTDPDLTIEGEAVVLSESAANAARALAGATENDPDSAAYDTEADVVDSILIAGLPERVVVVKPGSASQLVVSLLNNGSQPVTFDVHVEGWVRDGWVPEGTHHVAMQPGERNALRITFAPPHDPTALAGEFPFVIVVRSTQHLRRVTRLHAKLVIRPYTDFALGKLEDRQLRRSSRAQTIFTLPVTNRSNHPIAVQLSAQTIGLPTQSNWLDPKSMAPLGMLDLHAGKRGKRRGGDGWQPNPTVLSLNTGETREVALRVMPHKAPLFGGRPIDASVRVSASVVGEVRMPRSATAELEYAPPIKPWHLALASAASLMLLVLTGMTALGATLFFGGDNRLTSGSQAPIVIVLNQNAPTSAVQGVSQGVLPTVESNPAAPIVESAPDNAVIVTADQITSPGEAAPQSADNGGQVQMSQLPVADAPAGAAPVITNGDITAPPQGGVQRPPAPSAQNLAPASATGAAALTYGEMFQEIALQYDLDWRLLAAQAYVETGLDALALGNDGDMGLMQILPNTWKEWAPTVGAVDPFDAYSNTLVASTYLDYVRGELGKRGYPQAQWMLVGYNWGPDRLIDFLEGGGTFEQLPAVRAQYASDIIKIARTIP